MPSLSKKPSVLRRKAPVPSLTISSGQGISSEDVGSDGTLLPSRSSTSTTNGNLPISAVPTNTISRYSPENNLLGRIDEEHVPEAAMLVNGSGSTLENERGRSRAGSVGSKGSASTMRPGIGKDALGWIEFGNEVS